MGCVMNTSKHLQGRFYGDSSLFFTEKRREQQELVPVVLHCRLKDRI